MTRGENPGLSKCPCQKDRRGVLIGRSSCLQVIQYQPLFFSEVNKPSSVRINLSDSAAQMARLRAGLLHDLLCTLFLAICVSTPVSADRTLTAAAPNCASVHPECKACQIKDRKSASGVKLDTYLACTTCTAPNYVPFLNTGVTPYKSNCGKSAGQQQAAEATDGHCPHQL